jgi:hypothetical protein
MAATDSTTPTFSPEQQAKLAAGDGADLMWAGMKVGLKLLSCDGCKVGIWEGECVDVTDDGRGCFEPTGGSSDDPDDHGVHYCAACTAAGVRAPDWGATS